MSVYKPKGSTLYIFDFERGGHRFSGTTGTASRREAEAIERQKKDEAEAAIKAARAKRGAPMAFNDAAGRYWLEVGAHRERSDQVEWSLEWLVKAIGPHTPIAEISDDTVAKIVAKRRGERVHNAAAIKAGRKSQRLISPASVNRSVTEPLRKVLNRARKVWKQEVQEISWGDHLLKEPQERIRELSGDEEARLMAELRPAYHPVITFCLRMAFRLHEAVELTWDRVDWGTLSIRVTGKGDKTTTVPMTPRVRDILWAERGRHSERVFTWAEGKPLTTSGLTTTVKRALKRAKIGDFRFHDLRHTAATRLLRESGNLKMTGKLLRHSDLKSTMRYAHVLDDDLRDVMTAMDAKSDAAVPTKIPMASEAVAEKLRKSVGDKR